jgi:hypothetical protein
MKPGPILVAVYGCQGACPIPCTDTCIEFTPSKCHDCLTNFQLLCSKAEIDDSPLGRAIWRSTREVIAAIEEKFSGTRSSPDISTEFFPPQRLTRS